jgi:hypothetical protein
MIGIFSFILIPRLQAQSCATCTAAGGFSVISNGKTIACAYPRNDGQPSLGVAKRVNQAGNTFYKVVYSDANGNAKEDSHNYSSPPTIKVKNNCSGDPIDVLNPDIMNLQERTFPNSDHICRAGNLAKPYYVCSSCSFANKIEIKALSAATYVLNSTAGFLFGAAAAAQVANGETDLVVMSDNILKTGAGILGSVLAGLGLTTTFAGSIIERGCSQALVNRQTRFYPGSNLPMINNQIHPNPASAFSTLRLHLPEANDLTIEIFDQQGRHRKTIAMGQRFTEGMNEIPLQVQDLASGIYIVKITGNQGLQLTHRLVKK